MALSSIGNRKRKGINLKSNLEGIKYQHAYRAYVSICFFR